MRSGAEESTGNLQGKTHIGKDEKGEICPDTKYLTLWFRVKNSGYESKNYWVLK